MQHDLVVDNNDGYDVRIDINQALQALGTMMLGTVAPSTPYPCELWADQSSGKVWLRNSANTTWLQHGRLDAVKVADIPPGGSTGMALVKNSNVDGDIGWAASGLPVTGGTITGNLAVSGTLAVTGATTHSARVTVTAGDIGVVLTAPAGQWARYRSQGGRIWDFGSDNNGNFWITDDSVGAQRMVIDVNGNITIYNGLWVNAGVTVAGAIVSNGADAGIQLFAPQGQHGRYLSQVNNVRQWRFGCEAGGNFDIADQSAGAVRFYIDTAGNAVFVNGLTVSGAFSTGSISTGTISCGYLTTNNNDIDCHHVNVVDGVKYTNLGNHVIGFNNAGTTLTFYALGGSSGSWNFTGSDERLKKNIAAAKGDVLDEIRRFKLISFDMPFPDAPTRHFDCGFSAQNVAGVTPDSVTKVKHSDDEEQLVLDTLPILARCVGAIQQLAAKVEALEARIAGRA